MRRRSFLKTVPAILLSPALLSSCQEDPLPGIGKKVIIIGAGLSGIYAGHLLLQKGYEVEILEASDRWGGRIRALEGFADFVIELGAEEVHGQNTAWYKLVKKTPGLQFTNTDDQDYYWMANSLKTETAAKATPDGGKAFAFIDNASNYTGADVSVQAYADSQGVPASVQYVVNAQIGNEFGTSINRLSMKGVAEEDELWTAGDENLPVANRSYQTVIETHFSDALAKIALNTPVQSINYSSAKVKAVDANGVSYEGDYVLVTVPLPVLRDCDIAFLPALPSDKTAAMQKIGMGAGMKLMLKFNERFWAADTGSIIGSGPVPEYWYTAAGRGTTPVLTAFVMGEKAEQLSALGSSAVQTVLADLDGMFGAGVASGKFLDAQIMDWSKMPFVRGAYSFPVVGGGISQREKLAASVAGKVFFAGEATHTKGHSATMHGAFETAERAVAEIVG